mgnify:CR=1 FL=1
MRITFFVADNATHQLHLVQWTRSPKDKHKKIDTEGEWEKAQEHWNLFDKHLVGAVKGHHSWIDNIPS